MRFDRFIAFFNFAFCYSATHSASFLSVFPDCLIDIGNSAFYNCSNLNSVIIPDAVTSHSSL